MNQNSWQLVQKLKPPYARVYFELYKQPLPAYELSRRVYLAAPPWKEPSPNKRTKAPLRRGEKFRCSKCDKAFTKSHLKKQTRTLNAYTCPDCKGELEIDRMAVNTSSYRILRNLKQLGYAESTRDKAKTKRRYHGVKTFNIWKTTDKPIHEFLDSRLPDRFALTDDERRAILFYVKSAPKAQLELENSHNDDNVIAFIQRQLLRLVLRTHQKAPYYSSVCEKLYPKLGTEPAPYYAYFPRISDLPKTKIALPLKEEIEVQHQQVGLLSTPGMIRNAQLTAAEEPEEAYARALWFDFLCSEGLEFMLGGSTLCIERNLDKCRVPLLTKLLCLAVGEGNNPSNEFIKLRPFMPTDKHTERLVPDKVKPFPQPQESTNFP